MISSTNVHPTKLLYPKVTIPDISNTQKLIQFIDDTKDNQRSNPNLLANSILNLSSTHKSGSLQITPQLDELQLNATIIAFNLFEMKSPKNVNEIKGFLNKIGLPHVDVSESYVSSALELFINCNEEGNEYKSSEVTILEFDYKQVMSHLWQAQFELQNLKTTIESQITSEDIILSPIEGQKYIHEVRQYLSLNQTQNVKVGYIAIFPGNLLNSTDNQKRQECILMHTFCEDLARQMPKLISTGSTNLIIQNSVSAFGRLYRKKQHIVQLVLRDEDDTIKFLKFYLSQELEQPVSVQFFAEIIEDDGSIISGMYHSENFLLVGNSIWLFTIGIHIQFFKTFTNYGYNLHYPPTEAYSYNGLQICNQRDNETCALRADDIANKLSHLVGENNGNMPEFKTFSPKDIKILSETVIAKYPQLRLTKDYGTRSYYGVPIQFLRAAGQTTAFFEVNELYLKISILNTDYTYCLNDEYVRKNKTTQRDIKADYSRKQREKGLFTDHQMENKP